MYKSIPKSNFHSLKLSENICIFGSYQIAYTVLFNFFCNFLHSLTTFHFNTCTWKVHVKTGLKIPSPSPHMSETIRWVGLLFPRIPTRELTKDCMELKFNSSVSIEVLIIWNMFS